MIVVPQIISLWIGANVRKLFVILGTRKTKRFGQKPFRLELQIWTPTVSKVVLCVFAITVSVHHAPML